MILFFFLQTLKLKNKDFLQPLKAKKQVLFFFANFRKLKKQGFYFFFANFES